MDLNSYYELIEHICTTLETLISQHEHNSREKERANKPFIIYQLLSFLVLMTVLRL